MAARTPATFKSVEATRPTWGDLDAIELLRPVYGREVSHEDLEKLSN